MNHMMEYFVPNNSEADDSDYQSADTPINTLDDKEFSSGDKQYSGRNGSEEGARRRWYHKRYTQSIQPTSKICDRSLQLLPDKRHFSLTMEECTDYSY
jgi:hypothetical protein